MSIFLAPLPRVEPMMTGSRTIILTLLVIVILLAATFGYFVVQTTDRLTSLERNNEALQSSIADVESKAVSQNAALLSAIANVSARLDSTNANASAKLDSLSNQLSSLLELKAVVQSTQFQLSALGSGLNSSRITDAAFQAEVEARLQAIEVELGAITALLGAPPPSQLLYAQTFAQGSDGGPRWCGEKLSDNSSSSSYFKGGFVTKVAVYMSSPPTNASIFTFSSLAPNGSVIGLQDVADSVSVAGPYNFQNTGYYWYNFTFRSPVFLDTQSSYIIAVRQYETSSQMFTNQGFPGTGDKDSSSYVVCNSPNVTFLSQDATMAVFGLR